MTIPTALAALKTLLGSLDPTPQPKPVLIVNYPVEYRDLNFDRLPVVLLQQFTNQDSIWSQYTYGSTLHTWQIEILAFLMDGPVINDEQVAIAEQLHPTWVTAMASLLDGNITLSVTPEATLSLVGGELFRYRVGHLAWWDKTFFGVRYLLTYEQEHT